MPVEVRSLVPSPSLHPTSGCKKEIGTNSRTVRSFQTEDEIDLPDNELFRPDPQAGDGHGVGREWSSSRRMHVSLEMMEQSNMTVGRLFLPQRMRQTPHLPPFLLLFTHILSPHFPPHHAVHQDHDRTHEFTHRTLIYWSGNYCCINKSLIGLGHETRGP